MTDKEADEMTYGEVVDEMIKIGSDRKRAKAFFDTFVHAAVHVHGLSEEEAKSRVSGNLGYLMGYAPTRINVKMWQEVGCLHPVFGDMSDGGPSPEEALRAGKELAKKARR